MAPSSDRTTNEAGRTGEGERTHTDDSNTRARPTTRRKPWLRVNARQRSGLREWLRSQIEMSMMPQGYAVATLHLYSYYFTNLESIHIISSSLAISILIRSPAACLSRGVFRVCVPSRVGLVISPLCRRPSRLSIPGVIATGARGAEQFDSCQLAVVRRWILTAVGAHRNSPRPVQSGRRE